MSEIDLKKVISDVVEKEWSAFAVEHPNLAGVLNRQMLMDDAKEQLEMDPEYIAAMAQAAHHAEIAETIAEIVQRYIRGFLQSIW